MPPPDLEHRMVPAEADQPLHSGYRALLTPFLTAERVAALEPKIASFTHELLDGIGDCTRVDFVESFARPLPVLTALELLSLPRWDAALLEAIVKDLHAHRGTAKGAEAAQRLPARVSGSPKLARSDATMRSQASAVSNPPPSATPSTAAITGLFRPVRPVRQSQTAAV